MQQECPAVVRQRTGKSDWRVSRRRGGRGRRFAVRVGRNIIRSDQREVEQHERPPLSRYQNWLATSSAADRAISSPRFFSVGPERRHRRPARGKRSGPAGDSSRRCPTRSSPSRGPRRWGRRPASAQAPRPDRPRPDAREGTTQARAAAGRRRRQARPPGTATARGHGRIPSRAATRPRHAGIQPAARPISAPATVGPVVKGDAPPTIRAAGTSWPLSTSAIRV